jgi:hypothetical protein
MDVDDAQGVELIDDVVELRLGAPLETPLAGEMGEIRIPVRSAPISSTTAVATSSISRARFSTDPP